LVSFVAMDFPGRKGDCLIYQEQDVWLMYIIIEGGK
jgi:hypothetical protein